MTNHTQAPWFIDEEGDICATTRNTNSGKSTWVAMGCREETGIDFKSDADRDLIIAAPDMYEALVAAKALIEFEGFEETGNYEQVCDALKKARGEA